MKSSRRDLSNDVAEHTPILKNNQNTYNPHFSFTPSTDIAFPETGVLFFSGYTAQLATLLVKISCPNHTG